MPSSGVSKMMNVAVLAVRSWASSLSSITTSATQPLGRQRTKPARPTSTLSRLRPKPDGSSTPRGATTRISLLFWSAVFSTITVRPALERSSATTLWIRAHCSAWAPGGVSQRICQSPCTERTAPWALAVAVRPKNSAAAMAPAAIRVFACCLENPIRVDPSRFWQTGSNIGLIGNDGALKAAGKGRSAYANQVPAERPLCAYIGQSACQAPSRCKYGRFARIFKENAVPGGG